MAGDWIKMRISLAEDPAVIAMAAVLGESEFTIVGRLHHLWGWADVQSRDGHARGVIRPDVVRLVSDHRIDRVTRQHAYCATSLARTWQHDSGAV